MINNYIINSGTSAIMPYEKGKSLVIEDDKEIIVNKSPRRIINLNCFYNGSSFEIKQRISGTLTGESYKLPLLLNNNGNVIMFPTESPRLNTCAWINYKNIKTYYKNKNGLVIIKFHDGKPLEINSSLNIIKNQILKSNFLNYRITQN